ncbi:uncharacterized protein LOC134812652 isoform X2 [Bolinopsis microptera]|uniref:uncharacterized protein LOC134812652 isoform X2 n=1 Tax=Bolinopsis microptera TaxID=2820187 RepID=UPI003079F2A2
MGLCAISTQFDCCLKRTLFSVVQSGLVSELAFELLDKYYSLLLDKECSVEAVLGTSPEEQCDNQIYKFQILLLLNPTSSLLATSHNLSTEFKYY